MLIDLIFFTMLFMVVAMGALIGLPWLIATMDTKYFFSFIEEGTGIFVMHGKEAHRPIVAWSGHECVLATHSSWGPAPRWTIRKTNAPRQYSAGYLGFLEKHLKVYWIGLPPFYYRYEYEFDFSDWKTDEGTGVRKIHPRPKEKTHVFLTKKFEYACQIRAAETGGTTYQGKEIGANLTVNIDFGVWICIVHPQIALFDNDDWFRQLESVLIHHANLFVGRRTFEDLRKQELEGVRDESRHAFSEYMMLLNQNAPVGGKSDSLIDALGVEIQGAQMHSIDLTDQSKEMAGATNETYKAEQDALAIKIRADAEAYKITTTGDAQAKSLKQRLEVMREHPEQATTLARYDAIEKAGEKGNLIVVDGNSTGAGAAATNAEILARRVGKELADKQ